MKALVSSDKVPVPPGPYSPGLTVGEWIFLSGQGGFDPNTGKVVSDDLAEQTEQKLKGVKPVRTTVRADLVAGLLVEITVAARSSQRATESRRHRGAVCFRTPSEWSGTTPTKKLASRSHHRPLKPAGSNRVLLSV